ncbi:MULTISPECIES: SDR family oxidoreductase [unclassified Mycolicibacterium]|uniref:SDR family oxidoreductase n=1 Tax=unclassified Mycolicibacterium TaxID=2636767 RepID=UPI001308C0BF|nr:MULTISPECIES: SDR family oxidoreductase [unclassified Mycolicibacterium]MUL83909.1 SDR family oxidoreductase [Mycolicibacterium sp. CBMA 329]MUL90025.1 SDR family oxidoreductase [Mycolicibacterium sp. CBMA 331]MUL97955.1 SDR family oxidoreductase [Mycolicibacterium sp. CBMA 334]MUM39540.1 SDR family oxidoreductase [Mycolicibacterium sp. CBMA 247]MUM46626.1 SDR family oxidoreductase [Mycolicibacterium sp. CBMA 294]
MQISLVDRTYLVTGGGSGIGKGAAAAIVASGGNALLVGRNADKLSAAAEEIGAQGPGSVRYEPADVTSEDEVRRAVDAATAWHGRLHGVVHSAGGSQTIGPITQIDSDLWRQTVDLNINATMYLIKHAGREMVRGGGGSFVGISSIASSNTHRWFGAYGPSKAAFDHLVKLAADELGPSWVRVNSIRPGLTRTEMVGPIFELPAASDDYKVCTPMPRFGEVEDIANLAVFLLSDASGWITGQAIHVDGGQGLRRGPDISAMLEPLFGADGLRGVVPSE